MNKENIEIIIAIDYFSRLIKMRKIEDRKTDTILKTLDKILKEFGHVELLVTDNAKEFCSKGFEEWCNQKEIIHYKVGIESHRSNGRVERVIGSVREGLMKCELEDIDIKLKKVEEMYNKTFHVGIKSTPEEAWNDNSGIARIENNIDGKYNKKFKKYHREKFKIGEQVLVAKNENLGVRGKNEKGRFLGRGVIDTVLPGDSYLVKIEKDRIVKKRHFDLKGFCFNLDETPSGEGDVMY